MRRVMLSRHVQPLNSLKTTPFITHIMNRKLLLLLGILTICAGFNCEILAQEHSSPESSPDFEDSFTPASLSSRTQGEWPNYVSTFGNSRYRLALDMSQSFNSISLWKFCGGLYKETNKMRLKHGSFLSVSIKGLSPQYDSITQAYKFANLHQEDKAQFNQIAKSIGGLPGADENTGASTRGADLCGNDTLKKLESDLSEYEIYLKGYIIDHATWWNDLQYINLKLEQHLKLKDHSAEGLKEILLQRKDDPSCIETIITIYSRIQAYSSNSIPPIQIENADLLNYEFTFYCDGETVDKRSYDFLVSGGFKIDFSAGFALSNLRSKSFLIKEVEPEIENVPQKKIIFDKYGQNIGAAVFAHFYPRTGTLVNISGTLGFMVNLETEYSYLAGASLIIGKKQRAIVSAGCNYGKVDRLDPRYKEGKAYDADKLDGISESQLTRKEWDEGAFISISYNF